MQPDEVAEMGTDIVSSFKSSFAKSKVSCTDCQPAVIGSGRSSALRADKCSPHFCPGRSRLNIMGAARRGVFGDGFGRIKRARLTHIPSSALFNPFDEHVAACGLRVPVASRFRQPSQSSWVSRARTCHSLIFSTHLS